VVSKTGEVQETLILVGLAVSAERSVGGLAPVATQSDYIQLKLSFSLPATVILPLAAGNIQYNNAHLRQTLMCKSVSLRSVTLTGPTTVLCDLANMVIVCL